MSHYQRQLRSIANAKYLKFKSRLEKSIESGRFESFSRRRKNGLLKKIDKFRSQLEQFNISKKQAAIAGSLTGAALIPMTGEAQIDPNFYLAMGGSVGASNATDVVIANIDDDPDLEIIFTTNSGGFIANYDGVDGYETSGPSSLNNARTEIFAADIDGDGDTDLIFTEAGDGTYVYKAINNGYGSFTSQALYTLSTATDVDLVDWDSDGDPDVVASSYGSAFEVLLNDGDGNFSDYGSITVNTALRDLEFADLDNDGDMDLLSVYYNNTSPYYGNVYAFENTTDGPGIPTFDFGSPVNVYGNSYSRFDGITVLDFDDDGDLDLFFHRESSVYGFASQNNLIGGTAFDFSDVNVTYMGSSGQIRDTSVADIDNDGDDDLIVAASGFNRLFIFDGIDYLNGSGGNLATEVGNITHLFNSIATGDLNDDGNVDMIGVNGGTSAYLAYDNAAPYITDFVGISIIDENSPVETHVGTLTFADIQGDDITVNLLGDLASLFHLDDGTGALTVNGNLDWETIGSDLPLIFELTDGDKTRYTEGILKLANLPEEGNLTFNETPSQIFGTRAVLTYEPGDQDMDGDTDMFVSSYLPSLYNSLMNQEDGSFPDVPTPEFVEYQHNALFVRANGDLDLFVHDRVNDEIRHHNNGESDFSSYTTLQTGILSVKKMIAGDFDGDSWMEVAVQAETSLTNEVVFIFEDTDDGWGQKQYFQMHNSGGSGIIDAVGDFYDIAIGDFDNDGLDDLLAVTRYGDDVVFMGGEDLGRGEVGFSNTYTSLITQADGGETQIEVGDVDGDGVDDIAIIRWDNNINYTLYLDIHINDGTGSFTQTTENLGGEFAADLKLTDIDADGDNDIVATILKTEDVGGELELSMDLETRINDGSGNFTLFQAITDVGGEDFRMMDVDGDDDLDIVMRYGFTGGEEVENQLKVYKNENVSPTAINLSSTIMDEHLDLDTEIATLSVDDLNPGDTHAFSLATGDGSNDEHNSFFNISGNSLSIVKDVTFEDTPQLNIYLSVYDGHHIYDQAVTIDVNDVNLAPTGINLSATSFDEGVIPGTEVAVLTADDPNVGDEHTFDFAVGDGINDADNGSFILDGDRLLIADETSFESKSSYNIYLSVSDIDNSFEQAFTITVNDINQAPTGINLSTTAFDEGTDPGSSVATITAVDANAGDTHTFVLSIGDGSNDADNDAFIIDGDQLIVAESTSFEAKSSYNIHLTASDTEGSVDQAFTLTVNDINQAPTGIQISAISFDEGTTPGTSIATLTADDANVGDSHTFELSSGDGSNDADNASFVIDGDQLIIVDESNFETKPSYNIHLTASDEEGSVSQAFLIGVNDVNQAPTAISLSNLSLDEGSNAGTVVATISVTDPNAADTHLLSLATGDGTNDAHNDLFVINDDELILLGDVSFDDTQTLQILISANDGYQSFEQAFDLTVNDVLGLLEEKENSMGIYPNPGTSSLNINMLNDLRGDYQLKVYDLSGKIIHAVEAIKAGEQLDLKIDMVEADPGIYQVEMSINGQVLRQRWIKR